MALPEDGDYNRTPYPNSLYIMLYDNHENENFPCHWHTAMEIIMPIKDTYEVQLRNQKYLLRENDILFIPPLDLHAINVPPKSENGQRIILMFEPAILLSLPGLSDAVSHLDNLTLVTPEETPDIYHEVQSLLMGCYDDYRKGDLFQYITIYVKIIELFVLLMRYQSGGKLLNLPDMQSYKRKDYITRLASVFEYINCHLSENMTLESAAKIANFSKFHFERIFKGYTNMPFLQFVKLKRITRSEMLLLNPEMSIIDVAMESGFRNVSAFNRAFKEIKHCTPSEFRKIHTQNLSRLGK